MAQSGGNAAIPSLEAAARAHWAAQNGTAALADYQKLALLNPKSAVYEDQIGFLLAAAGRVPEGIPHLRRATELDQKLAVAWYHLGVAQCLTKQTGACLDGLQKAVLLAPNNGDYCLKLWVRL